MIDKKKETKSRKQRGEWGGNRNGMRARTVGEYIYI